jgi:uncharacterized protein HemY
MGLGLVAEKSQDFGTAVHAFSQVSAIQASDVAYLLLAHALEQTGRNDEAQAATEEAKKLTENIEQARQIADGLLAQ